MKNNQYPKDLISAAYIMKIYWRNYSGTIKTDHKTSKHENFKKQNKSGWKEEKVTEEESQASFAQKS